jgi:hypothetical protein
MDAEMATVGESRDSQLGTIATEVAVIGTERQQAADLLPGDLLALYERVRAHMAGLVSERFDSVGARRAGWS